MTPLVRSILLVFTASVIGSLGMAFLKMGSAHLTRSIWSFVNPKLLFGIALFLGSSVFYAWGIKDGQLSVLYPMVSLGYVWGLLWAKAVLQRGADQTEIHGPGADSAGRLLRRPGQLRPRTDATFSGLIS